MSTQCTAPFSSPEREQQKIHAAWEEWIEAPIGILKVGAYHRYREAAYGRIRGDEVCACGVIWQEHFPVGNLGCEYFETKDDEVTS